MYIDEFTEYQTRDMPARQTMGAFVPSKESELAFGVMRWMFWPHRITIGSSNPSA